MAEWLDARVCCNEMLPTATHRPSATCDPVNAGGGGGGGCLGQGGGQGGCGHFRGVWHGAGHLLDNASCCCVRGGPQLSAAKTAATPRAPMPCCRSADCRRSAGLAWLLESFCSRRIQQGRRRTANVHLPYGLRCVTIDGGVHRGCAADSECSTAQSGCSACTDQTTLGLRLHPDKRRRCMQRQPIFAGLRVRMSMHTDVADAISMHEITQKPLYRGSVYDFAEGLSDFAKGGQVAVSPGTLGRMNRDERRVHRASAALDAELAKCRLTVQRRENAGLNLTTRIIKRAPLLVLPTIRPPPTDLPPLLAPARSGCMLPLDAARDSCHV